MFRRQFKMKKYTQVKGSDRKKIRSEIGSHFPQLTDEDLCNLFPNKESISTMKIITHCGVTVLVYYADEIPLFFEVDNLMYPTVFLLWKFPSFIYSFTTHPVVFSKIIGGADLMLPGVVVEEPFSIKSFGNLRKGDVVSINLTDNRAPIAVGTTALSSFDMYMSAKRGKCVHIAHHYGDFLCANIKLGPPSLGPPPVVCMKDDNKLNVDKSLECIESDDLIINSNTLSESVIPNINQMCLEGEVSEEGTKTLDNSVADELSARDSGIVSAREQDLDNELIEDSNDASNEHCPVTHSEVENSGLSSQESMDRLMEYCFLKALKTISKKLTLPLLTSNFFKVHMIPACPKSDALDVKRSSYKKLSKFLKEMEGKQVIEVRELTKGVESIVSVNYGNPLLKQFVEDSDTEEGPLEHSSAKAPEVNEMYVINASTLPLFKLYGYKKGESLMLTSIREHITNYVMKNDLQNVVDKRFVRIDHLLSSVLRFKEDDEIPWKELMATCIERMGNSYSIGQSGSINKGKLKPIEISVATRAGNKKVTFIGNLDAYGIDLTEFAKKCQLGVAASATTTQLPGSKSSQVMVQGNQVIFLEKLLTGEYQIQKRYIRGLENAPKVKKSNRNTTKSK